MERKAVFIASEKYRRHSYGDMHPLGIPRVSLTLDLLNAVNAITQQEFTESAQATNEQLSWFHTAEYIHAMQYSEREGKVLPEFRKKHNLGNFENPYFENFFTTPARATGGSIQAAEQVLKGNIAFSPAGGMHHAMPDQAHGFCFFNDPVLAIIRLRQANKKVLYVDIDAHHGDGVEYAFQNEEQVSTFSIHMDTSYAYPFKGGEITHCGKYANAFNLPLPKGCNDQEYAYAFNNSWPEILNAVAPDVIVLQAGTDILRPDPLGKFAISTQLFLRIVQQIKKDAPNDALVVLGGGGYHPLSLARCWYGVWTVLSNRQLDDSFNLAAQELLQSVDWDMDEDEEYFQQFFQSPFDIETPGEIRDEVKCSVEKLLSHHPRLLAQDIKEKVYV